MWCFIAGAVAIILGIAIVIAMIKDGVAHLTLAPFLLFIVPGILLLIFGADSRADDINIRRDLAHQGFTVTAVDGGGNKAWISRDNRKYICNVVQNQGVWIIASEKNCEELTDPKKNALKPEGLDGDKK